MLKLVVRGENWTVIGEHCLRTFRGLNGRYFGTHFLGERLDDTGVFKRLHVGFEFVIHVIGHDVILNAVVTLFEGAYCQHAVAFEVAPKVIAAYARKFANAVHDCRRRVAFPIVSGSGGSVNIAFFCPARVGEEFFELLCFIDVAAHCFIAVEDRYKEFIFINGGLAGLNR